MEPELQTASTGYGTVAIAPDSQKVLRNTYLLLALTMVPTVAGAYIGMSTASVFAAAPLSGRGPTLVSELPARSRVIY